MTVIKLFRIFYKPIDGENVLQRMHEISLVKNIFSTLLEEFPGEIQNIRGIYLSVGLLSNVQPILMQNAFDAVLLSEPQYRKTGLYIEVLPVLIRCNKCDAVTEIKNYRFVCSCGEPGRNIVQGEELLITKVEFAADDLPASVD